MNLNEPEDSLPDFFCDTAPQDSNPSPIDRITDITDESRDSTNQSYPSFSYGHSFPDPGMIDEDTRHSVGSFQEYFFKILFLLRNRYVMRNKTHFAFITYVIIYSCNMRRNIFYYVMMTS